MMQAEMALHAPPRTTHAHKRFIAGEATAGQVHCLVAVSKHRTPVGSGGLIANKIAVLDHQGQAWLGGKQQNCAPCSPSTVVDEPAQQNAIYLPVCRQNPPVLQACSSMASSAMPCLVCRNVELPDAVTAPPAHTNTHNRRSVAVFIAPAWPAAQHLPPAAQHLPPAPVLFCRVQFTSCKAADCVDWMTGPPA
jgi:hypothetical protein